MTAVQQAEKALADAKQQEKNNYRIQELDGLIKEFQGKCFGSHTFDRYHAAAYMNAVYYEKFFIEDGEIYVLEHTVSCSHADNHYKKSMKQIAYNRNIYSRALTSEGGKYNASYNLYSGYSQFRKEISLEKFKQLWEVAEEANTIIKNHFNGKLPELKEEWITQGDFGSESIIEQCISDMDIEMIDFKNFPHVHHVIEYRTLPMFDKRRWLPKLYAKPILEWQIKQLEKDCSSQWTSGRRYEALQNEIKILKNFINTNL
jgi:hypothetical protein